MGLLPFLASVLSIVSITMELNGLRRETLPLSHYLQSLTYTFCNSGPLALVTQKYSISCLFVTTQSLEIPALNKKGKHIRKKDSTEDYQVVVCYPLSAITNNKTNRGSELSFTAG